MSTSSFGAEAIFGDLISDGIAGLQSALSQYGGSGINNFDDALAGLKAAGTAAVNVVGPAIDIMSGGDPKVKNITLRVWQMNSQLAGLSGGAAQATREVLGASLADTAAISGEGGTQAAWAMAVSIVRNMLSQYNEAYRLAKSYKVSAAGQAAARAAGTPKAAPVVSSGGGGGLAKTFAAASIAKAPASAPALEVVAVASPWRRAGAPVAGGVVGLLLGGTVGFRLGAQVGMLLGGPLGAVIGAGIGYQISKQINP